MSGACKVPFLSHLREEHDALEVLTQELLALSTSLGTAVGEDDNFDDSISGLRYVVYRGLLLTETFEDAERG
jgi:hypothetical protein